MSRMHCRRGMRVLATTVTVFAGLGMGALVGDWTAAVPSAGAAAPAPQHYLCYQAAAKAGFKVPQGITLVNALRRMDSFPRSVRRTCTATRR